MCTEYFSNISENATCTSLFLTNITPPLSFLINFIHFQKDKRQFLLELIISILKEKIEKKKDSTFIPPLNSHIQLKQHQFPHIVVVIVTYIKRNEIGEENKTIYIYLHQEVKLHKIFLSCCLCSWLSTSYTNVRNQIKISCKRMDHLIL